MRKRRAISATHFCLLHTSRRLTLTFSRWKMKFGSQSATFSSVRLDKRADTEITFERENLGDRLCLNPSRIESAIRDVVNIRDGAYCLKILVVFSFYWDVEFLK